MDESPTAAENKRFLEKHSIFLQNLYDVYGIKLPSYDLSNVTIDTIIREVRQQIDNLSNNQAIKFTLDTSIYFDYIYFLNDGLTPSS